MRKYVLTDETMKHLCYTLHRIKAVRSFGNVQEGKLGGWVESEENLSQEGNCWVYGDEDAEELAPDAGRVEELAYDEITSY